MVVKPSMAVEFITHLGVNIPEFSRNGIQMNTNIYHESGIETNVALKAGHLKFTFPAPKAPIKLFSVRYCNSSVNNFSFLVADFYSCIKH